MPNRYQLGTLALMTALAAVPLVWIATIVAALDLQVNHPAMMSAWLRTSLEVLIVLVTSAGAAVLVKRYAMPDDDGDDWRRGDKDAPQPPEDDGGGADWRRFEEQFHSYAREHLSAPR